MPALIKDFEVKACSELESGELIRIPFASSDALAIYVRRDEASDQVALAILQQKEAVERGLAYPPYIVLQWTLTVFLTEQIGLSICPMT